MNMKKYAYLLLLALVSLGSCNRVDELESNFDNKVYIQEARATNLESIILAPSDVALERTIQASLALPTDKDIEVTYKVEASLVDHFNKVNAAESEILDASFYELPVTKATIAAGNVRSTEIAVKFKNLDNLPTKKTFLLPVTIANATEAVMEGSKTMYYQLKKGALIVVAADITNTFLGLKDVAAADATMGSLSAVTMEALIRVDKWGDEAGNGSSITTFMGIEGYFLIRMGDNGWPPAQIQVSKIAGLGSSWPPPDDTKKLKAGEWLHVALTFDAAGTREMTIYINGKTQSKAIQNGTTTSMNLVASGSNPFYIGKSWETSRRLNGKICEARIWNKVRSAAELNEGKYGVPVDSDGLVAYWKFDEGAGNDVHDRSGHGNDLIADNSPSAVGSDKTTGIIWAPVELGLE
jgi:hypothetical protein